MSAAIKKATLVVVTFTVWFVSPVSAQQSSCRTASDSASAVIYSVKRLLAMNNLDTTNVSLVIDPSTCQAVVNGYNAASDASLHITTGYVAQAGTTYVLYLFPVAGTPYKTQVIVLFDNQFQILVRMEGSG